MVNESPKEVTFTIEQMLEAISYGFSYHRDSQNDNIDVPVGNKIQWMLGTYITPGNWGQFIDQLEKQSNKTDA